MTLFLYIYYTYFFSVVVVDNTQIYCALVFDKKEDTGEQIDRFDEGYLFGVNLNQNLTSKVSVNFSFLYNIFESTSHYIHAKLVNYTTMTIGIQYNLYGSNFKN